MLNSMVVHWQKGDKTWILAQGVFLDCSNFSCWKNYMVGFSPKLVSAGADCADVVVEWSFLLCLLGLPAPSFSVQIGSG